MSKTNAGLEDLDITNEELSRFTKAFKNDEFKKLFSDYCEEINDPENRRIYEAELKQLESERGIDLTFLHPLPGYVLKTTTNGDLKTFINVAKCDKIGKPSSKWGVNSNGEKGLDWSLPYAQSTARRDYDKNKKLCSVYDVVFHPDTIHLAQKNAAFKNLVSTTALDAVATANNITLDMVNVKSPKISFKGHARPTVIRKKSGSAAADLEPSPIDHMFPPLREESLANKVEKNIQNESTKQSLTKDYTTPKYTMCQRKNVDFSEMTNELDAKLNSVIPSELVIDIALPLLRTISDTTLDVTSDELYLVSEVPAKYKLQLKLPYTVDESRGSAKFDNSKRSLLITLPVHRKPLTIDDITNGNGLCSEGESEQYSPLIQEISQSDVVSNYETKDQVNNFPSESPLTETDDSDRNGFLDDAIFYECPSFICESFSNTLAITLEVKNVDPSTIEIDRQPHQIHLKCMSIGSGCFPQYYAFFINFPTDSGDIIEAQPDVWDNHVILQIEFDKMDFAYYEAGVDAEHLTTFEASLTDTSSTSTSPERDVCNSIPLEKLTLNSTVPENKPVAKKEAKKTKDKRRSYSESNCDDFKEDLPRVVENRNPAPKSPAKLRTYSECSSIDDHADPHKCLKGILKRRSSSVWSISESSFDENAISRSVDFTDNSIPEEHMEEHCKKSVRFDNNIRKFLFRSNSTIVGQRKPKTNKRKKKKRTTDRRYSEGESSDYDPKHSSSEGESNGKCGVDTDNALHDSGVDLADQCHDTKSNGKHGVNLKFKSDMIFDIDM